MNASSKLLLLVEDNPDNVTLIRRALARAELAAETVVAGDDREAREFLYGLGDHAGRDPGRVPDLILLDVNLPGMSGLDFLRLLRINVRTRNVPIVVFTSSSQPRDVERAYERGATSFVTKPIDYDEFSQTVATLARYWLTLHVPAPAPPAE
jgi:two-component system response regulator